MPNLRHLTVKSLETYLGHQKNILQRRLDDDDSQWNYFIKNNKSSVYMNGHKWEEILVNCLPKLQTFRIKMEIQYWSSQSKENAVDILLNSFESHYWIREHRWFVRCDWNPESKSCYVCLYTLPYAFDHFDTHTAPIRSKSTSPDENNFWNYDRVDNLHYDFSLSNNSVLSRIRYSNIRHLSIELPCKDYVWSTLSTFVHLKSLDVFILNDNIKVQTQLQMFLDRAPNLYSLRLSCGTLSARELILLKMNSTSLRRLDLHQYTGHDNYYWFNIQQCLALCNSTFGIHCEVLRIRVENPQDALELVYSMPHLRALDVQILNDQYNIPDFKSSSIKDEVIQLLQQSLDSTGIIARNKVDTRFIQLWIR